MPISRTRPVNTDHALHTSWTLTLPSVAPGAINFPWLKSFPELYAARQPAEQHPRKPKLHWHGDAIESYPVSGQFPVRRLRSGSSQAVRIRAEDRFLVWFHSCFALGGGELLPPPMLLAAEIEVPAQISAAEGVMRKRFVVSIVFVFCLKFFAAGDCGQSRRRAERQLCRQDLAGLCRGRA